MKKREYTWYVEPLDSHTNLAVSMQLSEENFGQFVCADQERHNLWRCDLLEAVAFWRSKISAGLTLNVYNQEGNGQIRLCNFLMPKKKIKTAG